MREFLSQSIWLYRQFASPEFQLQPTTRPFIHFWCGAAAWAGIFNTFFASPLLAAFLYRLILRVSRDLNQIWGADKPVLCAANAVFRFCVDILLASFRNYIPKSPNVSQMLEFSTPFPVKYNRGVGDMSASVHTSTLSSGWCFGFPICCVMWSKIETKCRAFWPPPGKGRWAKSRSQFYELSRGPNLWHNLLFGGRCSAA